MRTFFPSMVGAFIGALAAILFVTFAMMEAMQPGLLIMGMAAEKTLGPAESERLVREKLGREWHAGQ